jgi:hypothetical protein
MAWSRMIEDLASPASSFSPMLYDWTNAHPAHDAFQQSGHDLPWIADFDLISDRLNDNRAHGLAVSPARQRI